MKESKPFAGEKDLITEIDLGRLHNERRRMTTFTKGQKKDDFTTIWFDSSVPEETKLTRSFEKTPFVPSTRAHREEPVSYTHLVAKEGFEPVVAKDGFEALDLFKKANPAVVLLDVCLLYTSVLR